METSKILARIIGPVMIIPAIGIFLNFNTYQGMIGEFSKSPSLCYLGGFMALLMGLVILQFHNKWEAGWPVVITILGWITIIKGVALIIFPGGCLVCDRSHDPNRFFRNILRCRSFSDYQGILGIEVLKIGIRQANELQERFQ